MPRCTQGFGVKGSTRICGRSATRRLSLSIRAVPWAFYLEVPLAFYPDDWVHYQETEVTPGAR